MLQIMAKVRSTILLGLSVLLLMGGVSCDYFPYHSLRVNRQDSLVASSDCCPVLIKAGWLQPSINDVSITIEHHFRCGNLAINPSEFTVSVYDSTGRTKIQKIWFNDAKFRRYKKSGLSGKDSIIRVCISVMHPDFIQPATRLIIYPSDFITCNGRRIISDTLKLELDQSHLIPRLRN